MAFNQQRKYILMNIDIRKATIDDMAGIHELVKELARYENAEDQVKTTVADYEKNFLSNVFDVIVAEDESGDILGMTLYFKCWSTWKGRMLYLDDFVVKEEYRKAGIGQLLFDALLNEGRRLGCSLVKWQVLDWNEPALKFYEKNEAIIEKEWWNGKVFLK